MANLPCSYKRQKVKDYPHSIFELLKNEKGVSVIFDWVIDIDFWLSNFHYQLIIFAIFVKDKKAKTSK